MQGRPGGGHHARGSALEVMEAVTPVMAVTAVVMSMIGEPLLRIWNKSIYFSTFGYMMFTLGMIALGSVIAFYMVLVEFVLIARTSALTFMVAGVFKEFLTIVVGHFVFGDELSWMNVFGLFVLIFGVILFNIWKWDKMEQEKAAAIVGEREATGKELQVASSDDQELLLAEDGASGHTEHDLELSISSRGTEKHSGGYHTEAGGGMLE
jgi:solute carrier family 35, member C2